MTVKTGRAVGDLACQTNSYLRSLITEVVSCVPAPKENASSKKQKKAESSYSEEWLVECADSVLFPEGGGQPCDHGTVIPLSGDNQTPISVQNIKRQGLRCILYLPKPLTPGDKVRQEVTWKRRWDHMQQHTGQHLLSAIMEKDHNLPTLGWGMGSEGNMNYVDLPRKPTEGEMLAIQNKCAEYIRDNIEINLEKSGDANTDKIPDDYDTSQGIIRVIRIGDIDSNACCGTHLQQTSHISLIILGSTQSVHGKNCRLSFVTGDRAIALATSSVSAISSIGKLASAKSDPSDVVNKVSDMAQAVTDLRRVERKLILEIAKYETEHAKTAIQAGRNCWIHRPDGGMDFINKIINEMKDALQGTGRVIVCAVGEHKGTGPIAIVGDTEAVSSMAEQVKGIVKTVKGGGSGNKWQGKVTEWQNAELTALKNLIDPASSLDD